MIRIGCGSRNALRHDCNGWELDYFLRADRKCLWKTNGPRSQRRERGVYGSRDRGPARTPIQKKQKRTKKTKVSAERGRHPDLRGRGSPFWVAHKLKKEADPDQTECLCSPDDLLFTFDEVVEAKGTAFQTSVFRLRMRRNGLAGSFYSGIVNGGVDVLEQIGNFRERRDSYNLNQSKTAG
jgi:hypothetical protein